MDSDALVCFQQTRRGTGERWYKVYRVGVDSPDGFVDRMGEYVRQTHFDGPVTAPHWFDTGGGPAMQCRLAELGEKLVPFSTADVFVVTHRTVRPLLAVPMAVDIVPVLAEGIRTREYAGADCDTDGDDPSLAPAPDATPTRVVDADAFDPPLSGAAASGGRIEWFHLFALQAAYRLAVGPRTGVVETGGDHPTMRVRDGDGVLCLDLLDTGALKRIDRDLLFLDYALDADAGGDADRSVDESLTLALRDTARLRWRYASHLWHVRHGETDERFASIARNKTEPTYADERAAARGAFLDALCEAYGASLAPFSTGVAGAALRWETGTRADTFSLNEAPSFTHDSVAEVMDRVDPGYVPEKRKKRF
ncbi:hypothetical protein [Halobaculum gomorrense]|uniref:Uncharacterized protein n=1 Tax=Halobaculum gomorrense TaxID=43928 RepID=A0A1M5UZ18_9EURY|nr:hypothetical protein [Halobaculum gomorrense]SHH67933.1 hypothetical protein SAMN05443636_3174 [Halobaculum gomorrense]